MTRGGVTELLVTMVGICLGVQAEEDSPDNHTQ